ncbi:MAG: hypothetical protein MUE44_24935 [Oscillatoriaceae cyanobacterium Prado104]|nr:hypothetical protein [Oscillatoriaceae cyanobacterium Prado104]
MNAVTLTDRQICYVNPTHDRPSFPEARSHQITPYRFLKKSSTEIPA